MPNVARLAPAKINLTLEVLGRRPDGYHELRSVITTAGLWDTVEVGAGRGVVVSADETYDESSLSTEPGEWNTIEHALGLMIRERSRAAGVAPPSLIEALRLGTAEVSVRLHKEIPAAAGLGGGSSDGVATLLALDQYWQLGFQESLLTRLALEIGSDCPFFLRGGVQVMAGRGEILEPLPLPPATWLCILKPPLSVRRKTGYVFSLLGERRFDDGSRTASLARRLRACASTGVRPEDLYNAFDAVADVAFGNLDEYRSALLERGALAVHLCGSGPALYGLYHGQYSAERSAAALRSQGYQAWPVSVPTDREPNE